MIAVVLVPIVEKQTGQHMQQVKLPTCIIALANIASNIFEKLLYDRISYALSLTTCSNQFGFKTKHSTDMSIYAFKEAGLKYRSLNSNVYSCFLDASKAFDRVNHYVLFDTVHIGATQTLTLHVESTYFRLLDSGLLCSPGYTCRVSGFLRIAADVNLQFEPGRGIRVKGMHIKP